MNFNVFNSIILAGIVQGLIFGFIVLMSKKNRHKSVYFLITLIITYSLSNFQFYLQDIGVLSFEELYHTIYLPWADLTPALLYFYVMFYLYPKRKIKRKEFLLFLPLLLSLLLSIVFKLLFRIEDKTQAIEELTGYVFLYIAYYAELIGALFSILVIAVLFLNLKKYMKEQNEFQVNHVSLQLNWLNNTLMIFMVLVILWLLTVYIDMYIEVISFYPVWLGVAFLIYWLGHMGIYKYGVVEERKHIRRKNQIKINTNIESKTKSIIIDRLRHFLEKEKRFLDSSLTLEKTAQALELSQGHLSKTINNELGVSFKDYLNALRVEEAKSYLVDDDFSNYTLVAIGLEAGFNSKSAFNSSFKKVTGETPSQFKKRHIN